MKAKIFVSGCLGGAKIRYNGTGVKMDSATWSLWEAEERLFYFCPELAAGFPVPRPAAEVVGGTAKDVIARSANVIEDTGNNVTELFIQGAKLAVEAAQRENVVMAILTDGSPSCGSTYLDAGSFDGEIVSGRGVLSQMLIDAGIEVFSHANISAAAKYLNKHSLN
jgi:uncharacterized protein YbbK (DUF523 family)